MLRFTTGLTNGSRRPVILITLGSCFLATSGPFLSLTATICLGRAGLVDAFALGLGAVGLLAFLGAFAATAAVEGFALLPAEVADVLLAATAVAQAQPSSVMRFVRFRKGSAVSYGILGGETIHAIRGDLFGSHKETGARHKLADVKLLAPCTPSKVLAVGLNYKSHIGNRKPPTDPEIGVSRIRLFKTTPLVTRSCTLRDVQSRK